LHDTLIELERVSAKKKDEFVRGLLNMSFTFTICLTRRHSVTLGCLLLLAACSSQEHSEYGVGGGTSSLSEMSLDLPRQAEFAASANQVNGYNLRVEPIDCSNGTRVDRAASLSNPRVSQGIKRGCDYKLTFSLGSIADGGDSLSTVYYETTGPVDITRRQLEEGRVAVSLRLAITEAGRQAGLPERPGAGNSQDSTPPNQDSIEQQNQVGERFDLMVTNSEGQQVNLNQQIRGELIMVDFASDTCGPCFNFARQLSGDQELQRLLSSGKCNKITYVRGSMATWRSRVGDSGLSSTFIPSSSTGWQSALTQLIGTARIGTPHVAIFRRDGTLVERGSQNLLAQFKRQCGAL